MITRLLVVVALVALLSSCLPHATNMARIKNQLGPRAAFDLRCAREQLQFTLLDGTGFQVGVEGCNRRVVYLWIAQQGQYVANSASFAEPSTQPAPTSQSPSSGQPGEAPDAPGGPPGAPPSGPR